MKKLSLINYEGDCLKAIVRDNEIIIVDQYGEDVKRLPVHDVSELWAFIDGAIEIEDSIGTKWNFVAAHNEAKPSMIEVYKFLEGVRNGVVSRVFNIEVGNIEPEDVKGYIEEIKNRLKQPPKFEEHEGGMTVNQLKDIIDSLVRTGFGDNIVKLDVNEYFKNLTTVQVGTGDNKGQIHLL